jgi:hypothetical protein
MVVPVLMSCGGYKHAVAMVVMCMCGMLVGGRVLRPCALSRVRGPICLMLLSPQVGVGSGLGAYFHVGKDCLWMWQFGWHWMPSNAEADTQRV